MPNGLVTFSGIERAFAGHIQLGLGVFPSTSIVHFLPQDGNIPAIGTLYGECGGIITVPGCLVDAVGASKNDGGASLYAKVLDPRWGWKWKLISGRYNVRKPDGTIEPSTQKTPQELATLLYNALGMSGVNVAALPNTGYPSVHWVYAEARLHLQQLLHSRGCDNAYDPYTNTCIAVRLGVGNPAITSTETEGVSYTVDPPLPPDELIGICSESLYESLFELEAVGKDTDGEWKAIDDLTYKPTSWTDASDVENFAALDDQPEAQSLARQTLYRCYRIKNFADGSLDINGLDDALTDIAQTLPLNHVLLESYEDDMGVLRPKPCEVAGFFIKGGDPPDDTNAEDYGKYDGAFHLNRSSGIVTFQRRVYLLDDSEFVIPAKLYLRTSFGLKKDVTGERIFAVVKHLLGGGGPNQMPVQLPELAIRHTVEWDTSDDTPVQIGHTTNETTVEQDALAILQGQAAQFQTSTGGMIIDRGVIPRVMNGVVRQLQWVLNMHRGATSIAFNNYEMAVELPRMNERRAQAMARLAWEHLGRQQADDDALGENGALRPE